MVAENAIQNGRSVVAACLLRNADLVVMRHLFQSTSLAFATGMG